MIRKTGDWDKVGVLLRNLKKELKESSNISLKRFGLKAEGAAKKHLSNQDLGWPPLSPNTIAQKIRKGYSTNVLIATSSYFQSINSWVKDNGVFIGVNRTAQNADGDNISVIARVHEYGSKSGDIPKRPLWKPTFDETIKWHLKNNDPMIHFRKRLKKYL